MPTRLASIPRSRDVSRFAMVGLTGLGVNQLAMLLLTETLGLHYILSAIAATQLSSSWNFVATERWAFRGRRPVNALLTRYASFLGLNNATLLLRIPVLLVLTEAVGLSYLWSNALTLLMLFVARFAIADGWIWGNGSAKLAALRIAEPEELTPVRLHAISGTGKPEWVPQYRYDIAGILRIDSDVALRELAFFRVESEAEEPNLRIRVGRVGSLPLRRTRFITDGDSLSYFEQLGLASANFRITMGDPIDIRVAPLLANSPHVLYTNVVEALLRFLLVSKGYVLLHSASVVADGLAALLSAQTDTGKTSTVIRLVRDHNYQFLSDDMTIISPAGMAIQFPKPMTMSYHTMASIRGQRLRVGRRAALAIQSRLHSKSGRTVGRRLGTWNLPIMSVNSVVQFLVPPPKYDIDALLGCEISERAPIGNVFLMERGESLEEALTVDQAMQTLIDNTDDAYGFPPFSTFAPHIRIGGDDYAALRQKERALLTAALTHASIRRVRVPGHEWAEILPGLLEVRSGNEIIAIPIQAELQAIPIQAELEALPPPLEDALTTEAS
jgi:dolichol-phosphate mannosyltransferase